MNVKQTTRTLLSDLVGKGLLSEKEFEFVEDYPLSLQTTFRTGGPADTLFPLTLGAASVLYPALYKAGIPTFVLGNGSNVLAQDSGYDGVILSLNRFKETTVSGCEITATAGVSITGLAVTARKHSLGGMEFFYGIPGSVGGAVFMNAGAYGGECKDVLRSVTFVTRDGTVRTLPVD
ncbi:MAG: FAD-binding protein, partial [Clostridia bacterium]|nr:FAD-binding protein [Clostridia bacterium]